MNPIGWVKAVPWIACAVLALLLATMTGKYLGKRDELAALTTSVRVLGEAAEARVAAAKKEGKDNLQKVKSDHEKKLPSIRSGAVAAYLARMREPASGGGSVPGNPASIKVDDGSGAQCVSDSAFIADAAEDAAKVEAWRAWCILNHCKVED